MSDGFWKGEDVGVAPIPRSASRRIGILKYFSLNALHGVPFWFFSGKEQNTDNVSCDSQRVKVVSFSTGFVSVNLAASETEGGPTCRHVVVVA
jgi:hypothetical protein